MRLSKLSGCPVQALPEVPEALRMPAVLDAHGLPPAWNPTLGLGHTHLLSVLTVSLPDPALVRLLGAFFSTRPPTWPIETADSAPMISSSHRPPVPVIRLKH